MKMDAMQKRRMWKVAIVHFTLTIIVCLLVIFLHPASTGGHSNIEWLIRVQIWTDFGVTVVKLLQPLPFLVFFAMQKFHLDGLFLLPAIFFLIPLWSYAFAWLFVKLDNWLNHFPVFNQKVF